MKIAILGWGSLIWDPRNLEIDKTLGTDGWLPDGPMLPIEFSRISQDGRLTIVIDSEGTAIQTLYAISIFEELDHAILDLAIREGCSKSKIGYYQKDEEKFSPAKFQHKINLKSWIGENESIDAVIWTNLSKNFEDKTYLPFTPKNAVNYLKYQTFEIRNKAEQYIRMAPSIVDTPIRKKIEDKLGWTVIHTANK